ncbi:hypothetical protein [Mangrovimonas sp. ST2L15]|uniref:GldL-related protein n=1 Tax=Mangrovimonas sp. ST2L15 TaxID=1645916 RepID=UPI000B119C50|nr:hypothetical protein [Mangrovimonas sp. ST2L15]
MNLTENHIAQIKHDIMLRGVTLEDLSDSLLDHICCFLEQSLETDFETAYEQAIDAFGEAGLEHIEIETQLLITHKKQITMKKTMYFLGYIAVAISTTGVLFKIQHWPGASVLITLGIVILNFGFLPMYFYDKYKNAISN